MWLPFLFVSSVVLSFMFMFLLIHLYCMTLLFPFLHGDDVLYWLISFPLYSVCFPCFSPNLFRFDLVWFRLSCGHDWIRNEDQLM